MKTILMLGALALILAGCAADGSFTGSPHGYIGKIEGPIRGEVSGVPTIVPDGTSPMGYRKRANGDVEDAYSSLKTQGLTATGLPAIIAACGFAPNSKFCYE